MNGENTSDFEKKTSQSSSYSAWLVGDGRERCYLIITSFHLVLSTI